MEIYEGYKNKKYVYEELNGVIIHRTSIFVSKSKGITSRLRNYFSFVLSSIRCSGRLDSKYDFIFCESPPLFLGYSARYLSRKKKAKLIFNVSDLWPESAEKLGVVKNKFFLRLAYNLEKKLYRKSVLVSGQTQGICKNIKERFPEIKTYWLPNGADIGFYEPQNFVRGEWRRKNNFKEGDKIFLYAGIIGIAQGLEIILEVAKKFENQNEIKFVLLGSGPEKSRLMEMKTGLKLENVFFFEHVSKFKMPNILLDCDASIVPLKKLDIFKGAIPSKIFESLAMEIPVILGVDGEARNIFVEQGRCACYFEPENVKGLEGAINFVLRKPDEAKILGNRGRAFVLENFNREKIAQNFLKEIQKII